MPVGTASFEQPEYAVLKNQNLNMETKERNTKHLLQPETNETFSKFYTIILACIDLKKQAYILVGISIPKSHNPFFIIA